MQKLLFKRSLCGLLFLAVCLFFQPIFANLTCSEMFELDLPVDLYGIDEFGNTPFRSAIWQQSQARVAELLQNTQFVPSSADIHFAYQYAELELFRFFIEKTTVPLNGRDDFGNTILHYAVKDHNEKKSAILLKQADSRVSANIINNRGESPTDIAESDLKKIYEHPENRHFEENLKTVRSILGDFHFYRSTASRVH
jgi:hypothetical protein